MNDDKRLLRELKREVKKCGNRKRRRYLKDIDAEPGDFDFGRNRSDVMNERPARHPDRSPAILEERDPECPHESEEVDYPELIPQGAD